MRETSITLPELALVAGTRAALGAGVGLLLADRLPLDQRRAVGWTLFLVGLISTVPLAIEILGGRRLASPSMGEGQRGGNRAFDTGQARRDFVGAVPVP